MEEIEKKVYPFSLGILSFGYQIILLREIISLYDILEFSGLFFAFWFLWGWRGVSSGEKEIGKKEKIGGYFFLSYFGFALSLIFIRFFRFILKKAIFENLSCSEILILFGLSTLFPAYYSGKLFSIISKSLPIESIKLYKKEIIGSFFSGIFIYYGALGKFSNWQIAGIFGFYIISVFVLFIEKGLKRLFILLFIAPIFTFMLIDEPALMKELYKPYKIVYSFETNHGRYTIFELNSQYYFYENAILRFLLPYNYEDEKRILLPLLFTGKEKGKLLLYEKNPKAATEVLKLGKFSIDYLFGEKFFCKKLFTKFPQIILYLKNHLVNTYCTNPDTLIKNKTGYYDIIYFSGISPSAENENHFITLEFLKSLKKTLKTNGYLLITIITNTNFISEETKKGIFVIKKTLQNVFPNVFIGISDEFIFFLSGSKIKPQKEIIKNLKTNPNILTIHPFDIEKIFSPINNIKLEIHSKQPIHINTFITPRALYYFKYKYFTKYNVKYFFLLYEKIWFKYFLSFFLLFYFFILIKYKKLRKFISIPVISAFSIYSDVLLFFLFQEKFGYIYSYLVLIITMFFTGLIFGIITSGKIKRKTKKISIEILLLITLTIFGKFFFSYKLFYLLFSFITGSINSFIFITTSKTYLKQDKFSSKTYAFDLFGAFLGAIFFSIVCLHNSSLFYPILYLLPIPLLTKDT